jgi:hypothetical protein
MSPILIPTKSPEDWKRLLAQPDLHWKRGYSAMTLARAWEAARDNGLPPEVFNILQMGLPDAETLRLLVAIPEYKVALPGGSTSSQTDVVALVRGTTGLVAVAIEGKVDESLGPTVGQKRSEKSTGVDERLTYLLKELEVTNCPDEIRYQLLHRTVSALVIADDFAATSAVMLVQSFSPSSKWLGDFQAFARLFRAEAAPGRLLFVGKRHGIPLYIGWCAGDQKFREEIIAPAV